MNEQRGAVVTIQPGDGVILGEHHLATTAGTCLWGRLPCEADAPVLRVADGALVTIDTLSHEGLLPDQGSDPLAYFAGHGVPEADVLADAVAVVRDVARDPAVDGPHVVTGPIEIAGAQPGDLLAVTLVEATPRVGYGVISNRHGRGSLVGELPRGEGNVSVFTPVVDGAGALPLVDGGDRVVRFPLAPFLGIVGVSVPGQERPHSVPPGPHGGNIDVNLAQVGATIYLPVQIAGAGLYVGDPHFAQGDGEVCLTALEASLRVTLRLAVVPAAQAAADFGPLAGPFVSTPELWVPTGLDADLDEAVRACVRQSISFLGARYGMAEHLAYAYLSAATDVNISQVVDRVCGAHARIRKADFEALEDGR